MPTLGVRNSSEGCSMQKRGQQGEENPTPSAQQPSNMQDLRAENDAEECVRM